jgi:type IV pilus biogenesis protein CpaD/CtpE
MEKRAMKAMSTMSKTPRHKRTPYAAALYAAAIAALLSACAQTDQTPTVRADEAKHAPGTADASPTEAMPEVVIVASRERPDSRG